MYNVFNRDSSWISLWVAGMTNRKMMDIDLFRCFLIMCGR